MLYVNHHRHLPSYLNVPIPLDYRSDQFLLHSVFVYKRRTNIYINWALTQGFIIRVNIHLNNVTSRDKVFIFELIVPKISLHEYVWTLLKLYMIFHASFSSYLLSLHALIAIKRRLIF